MVSTLQSEAHGTHVGRVFHQSTYTVKTEIEGGSYLQHHRLHETVHRATTVKQIITQILFSIHSSAENNFLKHIGNVRSDSRPDAG